MASRGVQRLSPVPREAPCGQKMPNMSTVAIVVPYCWHKIIDITANMFINLNTYKPAIELFEQFGGRLQAVWVAFEAGLDATKKVTVLIFAIFCPQGLEWAVNQVPGEAVRGPKNTKRGRSSFCAPVFWALRLFAAGFTPPRRTASYTGRRRSRLGRAARRACPSRRCHRRELPRSRRRCGSWIGGAR